MDIGKITLGLVSILIAILFIALVAVPVIEDSQKGTPYEGDNTSSNKPMAYVEEGTAWSVVRSGSTITTTIGSGNDAQTETRTLSGTEWGLISNQFMVRFQSGGTGIWDFYSSTYYNSTTPATITVTFSCTAAGVLTITSNAAENPLNHTLNDVDFTLMTFSKGTWCRYGGPFNATLEQGVLYGNVPLNNDTNGPIRLYKTVDGEAPETIVSPKTYYGTSISAASIDSQEIHYEEIGGKQAIGSYDGVTTKFTNDGTQITTEYVLFWAPIHYQSTYEADNSDTNSVLMGVIPTILFVVTIMMAVRMISNRE